MKPNINYLEAKIIDNCNKKCQACIPFSNIAKYGKYEIEQYNKDIKRVSELFGQIKEFRILGGEPLLVSNLSDYIKIAIKYLKDTKIIIVTNGILLDRMSDETLNFYKENNIEVFVSFYPDQSTNNKVQDNIQNLKNKGVIVNFYKALYFGVNHDFHYNKKDINVRQSVYEMCRKVVDCTNIYNGKIYACPKPFSILHFNKYFGTNYDFSSDGIEIHNKYITGQDIINKLSKSMEACSLCTIRRGFIKWKEKDNPQIEDWVSGNKNNDLIMSDSDEDAINSILEVTAISIFKSNNRYNVEKIDLQTDILKSIKSAVLVFGSSFNIVTCEIMKIAFDKVNFQIIGIINEDDCYKLIFNSKKIRMEDLYKIEPQNILVFDNSILKALRVAAKIKNEFNKL